MELIEARWPAGFGREVKTFLPNPPPRHDRLQIRLGKPNHGALTTASTGKHLHTGLATGETFWYLSNGVSKEFFAALLEIFAREAEAGLSRIILRVLDNAGWHGPANLKIPDGIRLIHLPPYSPEPQPAETLWALVDEPVVNKHVATIVERDAKIAQRCVALADEPEQIPSRPNFHWWPTPIIPN